LFLYLHQNPAAIIEHMARMVPFVAGECSTVFKLRLHMMGSVGDTCWAKVQGSRPLNILQPVQLPPVRSTDTVRKLKQTIEERLKEVAQGDASTLRELRGRTPTKNQYLYLRDWRGEAQQLGWRQSKWDDEMQLCEKESGLAPMVTLAEDGIIDVFVHESDHLEAVAMDESFT
jgi:hypothetical protein